MLLIAVLGLVLIPLGISVPYTFGLSIISFISTKCFGENKPMIGSPMVFTLSGGNAAGMIPGSVNTAGPQQIPATATKTLLENGSLVMRINDLGPIAMIGVSAVFPNPPVAWTEVWQIIDPAQTKCLSK